MHPRGVSSDLTWCGASSRLLGMNSFTLTSTDITRATTADVAAVADVLALAFLDDPVFAWCVPDDSRRAAILPAFFEIVTDAVLGYEEVYQTASGGAALWVPPGEPAVPENRTASFEEALGELLGADGGRTFAVVELLESNHPADPSQYLWLLGVHPEAQGRGIGSALLSTVLERCDRDGTPAYLEATSPRNRSLYDRHGFVVQREISVDDCPPIWPMWRTPRSSGG